MSAPYLPMQNADLPWASLPEDLCSTVVDGLQREFHWRKKLGNCGKGTKEPTDKGDRLRHSSMMENLARQDESGNVCFKYFKSVKCLLRFSSPHLQFSSDIKKSSRLDW